MLPARRHRAWRPEGVHGRRATKRRVHRRGAHVVAVVAVEHRALVGLRLLEQLRVEVEREEAGAERRELAEHDVLAHAAHVVAPGQGQGLGLGLGLE